MFRKSGMKRLSRALLATVLTTIVVSCDEGERIHFDLLERMPPAFSVSGHGVVDDIVVLELPSNETPADPWSPKGETIWRISTPKRMSAKDFPMITYGNIPDGFSQTVPERGRPPELAEGRIYAAQHHEIDGSGGNLFFAIRGGKAVNVTDEVFRGKVREVNR